jgi:hypothetical protein
MSGASSDGFLPVARENDCIADLTVFFASRLHNVGSAQL